MLQVFHMDVVKLDQDVAHVVYVASVSEVCCKSLFKMFLLFQSYIAASVFMLQVASVLSGCCICFTHMLQVYVPNVSYVSDVCCIQVFHVASV